MAEKDITILGIESSCDETAAAVMVNGREMLSNVISSQIDIHTLYGGVVPEIASRKHTERINQVVRQALKEAGKDLSDLDAVAVTYGPGLVGALLVGVSFAKALCFAGKIPLVGVHHIEGHISANFIADKTLEPPFICLVVSGGHTHLVIVRDYGVYEILGKTQDDAAGEAFDKVARAIGLFSFSGLKSAVLNYLNTEKMQGHEISVPDVAASFQQSVVDVLVGHAMEAVDRLGIKKFALAGGVASNSALRAQAKAACEERGVSFFCPPPILCTDNAAMIGCAGYYEFQKGVRSDFTLNAVPNLALGER